MKYRHAIRNHTLKIHHRNQLLKEIISCLLVLSMAGAIGAMMALAI